MLRKEDYKEGESYFMIDAWDNLNVRHVRCPYQSKEQLSDWLLEFALNFEHYKGIMVIPETLLDSKDKIYQEGSDYVELSLREQIYGSSYEEYAKIVTGRVDMKDIPDAIFSMFRVALNMVEIPIVSAVSNIDDKS